MPRGLYKYYEPPDDGAVVCVEYDGNKNHPLTQDLYRRLGYKPPFEELPTKAGYDAREKPEAHRT